jgi:hypothetical protein
LLTFVEPFVPEANPRFQPTQEFRARVVLVNRDSILALETAEAIAGAYGFRMLAEDQVAINPPMYFAVESFTPAEGFTPSRPFQTRLRWRDLDGNDQSKLLLASPEAVLAALTGESAQPPAENARPERKGRRKARVAARPATRSRALAREPPDRPGSHAATARPALIAQGRQAFQCSHQERPAGQPQLNAKISRRHRANERCPKGTHLDPGLTLNHMLL